MHQFFTKFFCQFCLLISVFFLINSTAFAQKTFDKAFDSWELKCVENTISKDATDQLKSEILAQPICSVFYTLTDSESGNLILQITTTYIPLTGKYAMQWLLPHGYMLQEDVILSLDDKPSKYNPFRTLRCEPNGCYITFDPPQDFITLLEAAREATISLALPDERRFVIPFSLKGISSALVEMITLNLKGKLE